MEEMNKKYLKKTDN